MLRPHDPDLLRMALAGYQCQLATIETAMAELRRRLGRQAPPRPASPAGAPPPRAKHRISPEGRARIAAAQRERWAAYKKKA